MFHSFASEADLGPFDGGTTWGPCPMGSLSSFTPPLARQALRTRNPTLSSASFRH